MKKAPARPSTRTKRSRAAAKTSPSTVARARKKAPARRGKAKHVEAVPVTADDLRLLQRELAKRMAKGSGARAQVVRRQGDGSWLRLLDQPEFTPPAR